MRRLVLATAFLTLVSTGLAADPAFAACGGRRDGIRCGRDEITTQPGTPGRGGSGGGRGPARETITYPREAIGPDGQPCIQSVTRPMPPGNPDRERAWARELWELYMIEGRLCPGSPQAPPVSPRILAMSFWQDIPLPKPGPFIAPGWAITGKYAYLETHGERQHTYTRETPFGPLVLTARGRYSVDWGDGTQTGPYDLEGGPWPDGQITHTYIDVGTYDVVVTEQWSATWQLGGENGTLTGLQTEGRIEDLRVEQVQAVVSTGR